MKRRKRVYIAGPMTGLPQYNYPAFHEAARRLEAQGYEPVHSAIFDIEDPPPYDKCMEYSIQQLLTCDYILLLEGWQHSKGATREYETAKSLGMTAIFTGHGMAALDAVRKYRQNENTRGTNEAEI